MLKPWTLAALGLLAFAVLVWFGGPLLLLGGQAPLASPETRVLLIGVFVLQYLAQKLWQSWQARRNNERMVTGLAPVSSTKLPAEAAQLQQRFASALQQLRTMRFGPRGGHWSSMSWKFGRSYLYQLPWYMIIGAPGAGKTTALLNSGLSFPLAGRLGRGAVRGVGGTRNCDWWFTDQAVLIDTAGRYTTHESDRVADRQAWEVFMQLLRRARPRRPLNGVLVAVSIADLLALSSEEIAAHARVLRARLDELQTALRVRLPAYLLLTKCDLLPGFIDWFGALDRKDRDQVWGVTFDLSTTDRAQAPAEFAAAFEQLVDRLADGLTERLQAERDAQRRARIFSLPRQLRALGESLDILVRGAFGPSRAAAAAAPAPCVRGVYLTSATQQGTPIDRMLSAFGRELGLEAQILPPNPSTGKSFFLSRLLRDVVLAEAELSGRSPLRQLLPGRLRLAAIVAVLLCAAAVASWWISGYQRSLDDLARLDTELTRVQAVVAAMPTRIGPDPRALLPALNATAALSRAVPSARSTEFVDIGGRARRKLSAAVHGAYTRMLLGPFQARIGKAIEATLRVGADVTVQYEALKAYAMLRDPGHFDAAGFKVFVMSYWDSALSPPLSRSEGAELAGHFDALIAAGAVGSGITLEPALVESVRSRLASQPAAERIALRIAMRFDTHPYADFTVASLGSAAAGLFVGPDGASPPPAVPGRFTIEAYRDVVTTAAPSIAAQLASEASWVLAPGPMSGSAGHASGSTTLAESSALYTHGYARAWADLIDGVRLKSAASNQEAIQQAQALGSPEGPLTLLLAAIVRETASGLVDGGDGPVVRTDPLAARFIALAALITRDAKGGTPLDAVMQSFRDLAALRAPALPGAVPVATGSGARGRLTAIEAEAERAPQPVRSMLEALAIPPASTPASTAGVSAASLPQQIAARLGVPCIRLVAGRFPFARSALRDAPIEDFSRMFAPNGAFDQVFAQLAPRLNSSSETRRARDPNSAPQADEVERFRAAARIRDVFFAHGADKPAIKLTFRPLDMDEDIERFQLEVDGQIVRYAHGPPVPTSVTWPGSHGSARVDVTPSTEGEPLEFSGPWAVFRLMDHVAVQEGTSPGRFRVVFDVGGRHATFEVESDSSANPFRLRELERFECPLPAH